MTLKYVCDVCGKAVPPDKSEYYGIFAPLPKGWASYGGDHHCKACTKAVQECVDKKRGKK